MAAKRQVLGRGLDALFATGERTTRVDAVRQVSIDLIAPNPRQPRTTLDADKLA